VFKIFNVINKKKLFSILLIGIVTILAIGMMGTVSALDQTITTASSGGLKTAINNVGTGETVYMENGVYSGNDNTGITINKNLTISGKGNNVVIDAKGTNRIFIIGSGVSLTLKNLKLINGGSPDGKGGAIYNNGALTISGSTFTNNQAKNDFYNYGGAIYNNGTLTISGSTFTSNQAQAPDRKAGYSCGGAIYNNGSLILSGSTFINNQATYGGAINSGEEVTIISGVQQLNFVRSERISLSISSSTFENNRAESGGAIEYRSSRTGSFYCNSTLSITGSTFNNNIATDGRGGAIVHYGGSSFIKGGTIYTNEPSGGYDNKSVAKLIILNCNFNNNKAAWNGGAIDANEECEIKIDKTTFKDNIISSEKPYYNAINYAGTKLSKTGVTTTPTDGTKVGAGAFNPGGTTTTKLADLKITKITKKGSYRYVFVKNVGKKSAGKNILGVYIGKKLIKKVTVKAIGIGKTLKVTVAIPKKYMTKKYKNKVKTFKVDIKNVIKESNEKNNSFKAK